MVVPATHTPDVAVGFEALDRGDWGDARDAFDRATGSAAGDPLGWEGLAEAQRWLGDVRQTFHARERAYQLYREFGDDNAAARMAIWLAYDSVTLRGDLAVAGGWFARARRLLEPDADAPEHGWLAYREAELAIIGQGDPARALELGAVAAEVGRRLGLGDLEMVALALRGLAEVAGGDIDGGMRCLDEAAVAAHAGEVSRFYVVGTIYCHLISACERVRDLNRAAQWCDVTLELADRWQVDQLFGVCRSHYASLLIWRGRWGEAEQQLVTAGEAFTKGAPAMAYESAVRLGWLRCRQGRLDEAAALCEPLGWHPLAQLCLVDVALERGDVEGAATLVQRHLHSVRAADRLLRAPGWEAAVRIAVATGDLDAAERALAELRPIVATAGTGPLQASLAFSTALVAAARGDLGSARLGFAEAVDLWTRDGAPYEAALARRELGSVLAELGQEAAATREWEAAQRSLTELGAALALASVAGRLASLTAGSALLGEVAAASSPALSARELEVLRLVAEGLSDREIGTRLVLSPHTVHRHVANIRTKLGKPSRAAAVAHAGRINLI